MTYTIKMVYAWIGCTLCCGVIRERGGGLALLVGVELRVEEMLEDLYITDSVR